MANPENLVPFKPGVSGNPNGRPKGSLSLTTILKKYLDQEMDFKDPIDKKHKRKPIANLVVLKLLSKAIRSGDMRAIEQIYDRLEGKAIQKQEIKHDIHKIEVEIIQGDKADTGDSGTGKESEG